MYVNTLLLHRDQTILIEERTYILELEKMMVDKTYQEFRPVINEMLCFHIKLEQEKLMV